MKVVICPDSFKGSLSAAEAAERIGEAAKAVSPAIRTVLIPVADGGEGTADALGAGKRFCTVKSADFTDMEAFWGELGDTAVIELASCAGLPLTKLRDPEKTTTYGVGELILHALDAGKRDFVIGLGGSSTNDMGCGMASALGVRFYDREGNSFVPTGGTLAKIARIDLSGRDPRIAECRFTTMCDVTNPLYGEKGAAYVFAPQKGADPEAVRRLDAGLRSAAELLRRDCGLDLAGIPGTGAAGGCGAGVIAFLSSELKSGIDVVLDLKEFDREIADADLVLTGEGKFDSQSLDGKVVSGIAKRTVKTNTPLVVLAGCAAETPECYDRGVTAVFSIQRRALPLEEAMKVNGESLYKTAYNILKLFFRKGV